MSNIIDFNARRGGSATVKQTEPGRHFVPIFHVLEAATVYATLSSNDPVWRELTAQALATDDGGGLCELDDQQFEWFTETPSISGR